MIPLLFYVALHKIDLRPSGKLIRALVVSHCVLAVMYLSGNAAIFESIFSRYSASLDSVRGFSFLSQEPSYAASYLFAIFTATYISNIRYRRLCCWTTLALIGVTKSLTGLLFIVMGTILMIESVGQILLVGAVTAALVLVSAALAVGGTTRIGQIIELTSNINFADALVSLVILEPSGATRLLMNGYSLFMGFSSMVGYGIGSFSTSFMPAAHKFGADIFSYHAELAEAYQNEGEVTPQSAFASLAFEYGIFSLLYLVPIFGIVRTMRPCGKVWFVGISFACMSVFFQSEVSNPIPFYVLLLLSQYARSAPASGGVDDLHLGLVE